MSPSHSPHRKMVSGGAHWTWLQWSRSGLPCSCPCPAHFTYPPTWCHTNHSPSFCGNRPAIITKGSHHAYHDGSCSSPLNSATGTLTRAFPFRGFHSLPPLLCCHEPSCAGADWDRIRLVGRWRSDELFRYLSVQAVPVMHGFAQQMLQHGSFSLNPGADAATAIILAGTSRP